MASEGAKLALIAGDEFAMRVLAAWGCAGLRLKAAMTAPAVARIAGLAGIDPCDAEDVLARLVSIGCLRDRDISELADRLLQQRVLATTGRKAK